MNDNNIEEYKKEEEKIQKKSNTFNLVIGLATLLIALLGATFAYFTMTNGSKENEISVRSSYVSISYDGGTKVEADDLIPTSENVMLWAYQDRANESYTVNIDGVEENHSLQCIDSKNRKVCYVYQFTVRSDGEGDTTNITGTIKVNQNEFVEQFKDATGEIDEAKTRSGLSYMVFELTQEGDKTIYKKVSPSTSFSTNTQDENLEGFARFGIPTEVTNEEDATTTITSVYNYLFSQTEEGLEEGHINITNRVDHVFQLVIWLHDDNIDQNKEQAKGFAGTIQVNVKSDDNSGNITGTRDEEQVGE
jgi:hypothetical protein